MYKRLFIILCFVPLLGNAQELVHAMTYNIRLDTESDGKDQWSNRKEGVANYLADENADFIGLQEVLIQQLTFLDSALIEYSYIGVGRDDGKQAGEFSPLFYNHNKWKVKESKYKWLSSTPDTVSRGWDAACNRVVTYAIFENVVTGTEVAVFNTHFDHQGVEARKNSAMLISRWVEDFSDLPNKILMGDFNLTPDTELYKILTSKLRDSRKIALARSEDHQGTYNGFELNGSFTRRIDYIFVLPKMNVLSYIAPDVRINGRHVSDHFPIIVQIQLAE